MATPGCVGSLAAIRASTPHGSPVGLGVGLNAFVGAMMLVVLADSMLAFLIAWELMSLVSFSWSSRSITRPSRAAPALCT